MTKIKKTLMGTVLTKSGAQTINVKVETYRPHPIYSKRTKYTKKYLVHDAKNQAHVGDKVSIVACRPLSARKHFYLAKIVEKAVEA